MTVVIHNNLLDAATIHDTEHLSDTDGFSQTNHRPVFFLPNITPKVAKNTPKSRPREALLA